MPRLRPILAAVLVLALAACGGTADATSTPTADPTASPTETPQPTASPSPSAAGLDPDGEALLAAVEATIAEETVRVDQAVQIEGSAVVDDIQASATGQASFGDDHQMRLSGDFSEFNLGEVVMIRDASRFYMSGSVFDELAGEGNWLLVDLESDHPAAAQFASLGSGQNDVSMALFYFYGATGDIEVADGERIGGQATRHYSAEIDLESARERIPEDWTEALEDLIATMRVAGIPRQLDGQAWVGEDGLVHRVTFVYDLGAVAGGGTTTTTIDFSDFGAPMELDIPDDSIVVPLEETELGS